MGWSFQNLSSLFSKVVTDGACITTSGRLFHLSVDRVMNEDFLWFRRILSLNILCWCPLVWLPGPFGIFGVASVSYFPVMILYNSIMSPLILVALRCTFLILVIDYVFFRNGVQIIGWHILGVVSLML